MGQDLREIWRRIVLTCMLAIAFALQSAASAQAAKSKPSEDDMGPPMRFVVVRSSSPGCEPFCPEWISAEGAIVRATPGELKKFLKKLGDKRLPVIVTSPGGHVEAAWELGRILRARKLDIGVGLTRFVECAPGQNCKLDPARKGIYSGALYSAGAYCASACSMMFAGGVRRHVGQWAYMGVHQVTSYVTQQKITYRETYRIVKGKKKTVSRKVVGRKNVGSYTTTKMGKAFTAKMLAYYKEMGVKEAMYEAGQSTPAAEMRQLAPVEMLNMNLITSLDATDVLVSIENCKGVAPAANCILAPGVERQPFVYSKPLVPQMTFVVTRSTAPGCEPTCPEWISAEGLIDAQSPARLKSVLDGLGKLKLPIVLQSPGGDVVAAMALGRIIRANKIDVAVGRTKYAACTVGQKNCPQAEQAKPGLVESIGATCNSTCAVVLAGGVRRLAGPATIVGIDYASLQSKDVQALDEQMERYLNDMGMSPSLHAEMKRVGGAVRTVPVDELYDLRLTTSLDAAYLLTGVAVCKASPAAGNCVLALQDQPPPGTYPTPTVPEADGMWFAVVRSGEAGCEPTCPEWISAEGDIDTKASLRLEVMLKALGGRKLPIVVSSRGGDVDTAIAMGKMIRNHGLDVAVGSTVFANCTPRDEGCVGAAKSPVPFFGNAVSFDGVCTRSCMLVLAAGKARLAGHGTLIGWPYTEVPASAVFAPYLQEMEVNPLALSDVTPAKLDFGYQAKFVATKLLTRGGSVDLLVDGGVCGVLPMPANCRRTYPGEFAAN